MFQREHSATTLRLTKEYRGNISTVAVLKHTIITHRHCFDLSCASVRGWWPTWLTVKRLFSACWKVHYQVAESDEYFVPWVRFLNIHTSKAFRLCRLRAYIDTLNFSMYWRLFSIKWRIFNEIQVSLYVSQVKCITHSENNTFLQLCQQHAMNLLDWLPNLTNIE